MSFRIIFLENAEADMDAIEEYLSQFYADTVQNFFSKLKERVFMLEDMPYMCQAYEEDPFFRRMVVGDYVLFYSIDETRNLVIIHRIFHHSRNITRQMLPHRLLE
ncbi:MAG: type II toxin-antitoxin system RelE/ParE family toxin [Defluviitaleaceae bacterium]|nr:type II toxin-antitoxin system RelE/ParE family toxin [Defluviitaleaceae bacterium]